MAVKNAVILAAGRSFGFAPFSYEIPKALFKVHGETLIERQIRQLREAGVQNIAVVIGHMREKMFFLGSKWNVTLINNPRYAHMGNIYSMYLAKDFLQDCYLCFCDNYYPQNPFLEQGPEAPLGTESPLGHEAPQQACSCQQPCSLSYRQAVPAVKNAKEFGAYVDAETGNITRITINSPAPYQLVGHAYLTPEFAQEFICAYEESLSGLSVDRYFWEEFVGLNIGRLPMRAKIVSPSDVLEFDTIEDVRAFDPDLIENLDSRIAANICSVLNCESSQIHNIKAIAKGLTNVSFVFEVRSEKFVYRHPGGTSTAFVNRPAEHFSQNVAKQLGLDPTLVYIHPSDGWKISRYVEGVVDFSYSDTQNLKHVLGLIRTLHESGQTCPYEFNVIERADHLFELACSVDSTLRTQFGSLRDKAAELYELIKQQDAYPLVLSHNDCYYPNFLLSDTQLYLIDYEFTGMCDPANDYAGIVTRDGFSTPEQMLSMLELYLDRKPTDAEIRHYFAFSAVSAWYWLCWSLYKDSVKEDNGYFMYNAYQAATSLIDKMLAQYK